MTMCVSPVAPDATAVAATTTENLRLTVSKATLLRHLKQRIEQGVAIRRRRVRYIEDLEEARTDKSAWVQTYTDLLRQAFHGNAGAAIADRCNDWVGRVYPEYAETELFVEQFYEEMDFRLSRLREVARQIGGMPEVVPVATTSTATAATTVLEPATATPAVAPQEAAVVVEDELPPPKTSGLLIAHGVKPELLEAVQKFLAELGIDVQCVQNVAERERYPSAAFAVAVLGLDAMTPAVTFELGYLVGRLGHARACILSESAVQAHGVHCIVLDPTGGWHLQFARYLKRSGIEIDLNKLC